MTRIIIYLSILAFLYSCSSFDLGSSNKISGTTDIPMNKVGVTFSPGISLPGTFYNGTATAVITSVDGDKTTVSFTATLPTNYPILEGIKSKYKDSSGNLKCDATFKITDKGIIDYNNPNHEPFVLVKYDAKVGDKYTFEKTDGTVITREVVRKSTEDDYYWGGLLIKTVDVDQDSRIPGVEKITYFTNHKFGIVAVRTTMEDGTIAQVNLYPSAY
jgi:hypothetical protein